MNEMMATYLILPADYLNATAIVSMLSVLVLIFLFFYLNRYTGRKYFNLWTFGWMFYALWLALGPGLANARPFEVMLKHACVGMSAALLFWGSVQFLKLPARPMLLWLFMGFLLAWSYVGAYYLHNPLQIRAPIFVVIGLASLITAFSFYRLRKHREYIGAGLLSCGFVLWGLYLAVCPFCTGDSGLAGTGYLVSAVLQLFIAVSMIILVLEEARAANEMVLNQIRECHLETRELEARLTDEDAQYQGVMDRSKLHERLRLARVGLRQAQESTLQRERLLALGQMSRGIAHDINNALTPILGYSNLLLREPLPDPALTYIRSIKTAGEKISQSVNCIRDFYRTREAQDLPMAVDLNGIAEEAFRRGEAKWQQSPRSRGVTLDFDLDLQPGLARVMGRRSELEDALYELIMNGLESTPSGGTVQLRTGLGREADQVFVEIVDTGTGMDETARRHCLEPFFSTKEQHGAKGLGLSKVYGIMQRHDGRLEIESEAGAGTTARLSFPAVHGGSTEMLTAPSGGEPLPPLKILCIDDEPPVLDVVKIVLENGGHRVELAGDGQSGLEAFRAALAHHDPFDVVVTDLGMPNLDGQRVASAVKRESARTPVILLTGWGGIMQAEGDYSEHVDVILSKPPHANDLMAALRKVTAARSAERTQPV